MLLTRSGRRNPIETTEFIGMRSDRLVRDVQGVLPASEKKDAIGTSLAGAERQIRVAEEQIARGLGYQLGRCRFSLIPVLTVGHCCGQPANGTKRMTVGRDFLGGERAPINSPPASSRHSRPGAARGEDP
jgi:hypothetical protein